MRPVGTEGHVVTWWWWWCLLLRALMYCTVRRACILYLVHVRLLLYLWLCGIIQVYFYDSVAVFLCVFLNILACYLSPTFIASDNYKHSVCLREMTIISLLNFLFLTIRCILSFADLPHVWKLNCSEGNASFGCRKVNLGFNSSTITWILSCLMDLHYCGT